MPSSASLARFGEAEAVWQYESWPGTPRLP